MLHVRHLFDTYVELFVVNIHYLQGDKQLVENIILCRLLCIKYSIWLNVNILIDFMYKDNDSTLIEGLKKVPIDKYSMSLDTADCNIVLNVSDNVNTTRYWLLLNISIILVLHVTLIFCVHVKLDDTY